jgi:hypothetical protein
MKIRLWKYSLFVLLRVSIVVAGIGIAVAIFYPERALQGAPGPAGKTGPAGAQGADGVDGADGGKGKPGDKGQPGKAGEKGSTGAAGAKGTGFWGNGK